MSVCFSKPLPGIENSNLLLQPNLFLIIHLCQLKIRIYYNILMIDKSEILAVCLSNINIYIYIYIYIFIYISLSLSLSLSVSLSLSHSLSLSTSLNIFTKKPTKIHYTDALAIKLKCLREK